MIYTKATQYSINPEKLKGFIDYLYIFTQKARMCETNLSFEYGLLSHENIIVVERWTTRSEFENFIKIPGFAKEIETIEKMSKNVKVLYELDLNR
ncbi:hypothetical protein BCF59_0108 [Mycoplasmopsis mustelae]|uniref:Antibiotic biosynthesis monooxygenase n=1 Tax=Mycoplasmopsis mustelae TaxID=171289 RepID=A0A4V6Q6B7_9BACT|nr:antibiotic biosynthesis monooxygenase [Mycoplasmopsis mustelae]TDV24160.1 hypothetical protein BCF59_0108 [Mycoplasmopsis mustelae]